MSKELEALKRFYDDAVFHSDHLYEDNLLNDELYRRRIELIDRDFNLLEQALKRLEKFDEWAEQLIEEDNYAIQGHGWGQRKLELIKLYDQQPFKTLDEWDYSGDEK